MVGVRKEGYNGAWGWAFRVPNKVRFVNSVVITKTDVL